jgi:DNA modification methylase
MWRVLEGDCRTVLARLEPGSVHTCVTSPPYFGLRDYGTGEWEGGDPGCGHRVREDSRVESSTLGGGKATTGHSREGFKDSCPRCGARRVDKQIGLEPTPDEFVAAVVGVFREVRRVLRDDGTVWLNLGDSYAGSWGNQGRKAERGTQRPVNGDMLTPVLDGRYPDAGSNTGAIPAGADYKAKDLLGIPWMVAFALRADGWYLRSDIIWNKPNPMPESVTDRPTKSHEYVFLLSKGPRYFYDADAIREDDRGRPSGNGFVREHRLTYQNADGTGRGNENEWTPGGGCNKRSVWTVTTQPFPGAHFATFPPKLIEPCILAGCPAGGTVLDPFAGAGTTGMVALRHGRSFTGIELNPEYVELARRRIVDDAPLLNSVLERSADPAATITP